ncbi:hypothetical protein NDU88_006766 [Pleurodeles waltl]|uniref:Uncharacterized protein n=1 Tax=Pleurodeles waltl TaxID=8319 RepID=A0AAV7LRL6_PLEWA|nr:hypothetical protein NDU88_006766 [Pleurodeles waltl]
MRERSDRSSLVEGIQCWPSLLPRPSPLPVDPRVEHLSGLRPALGGALRRRGTKAGRGGEHGSDRTISSVFRGPWRSFQTPSYCRTLRCRAIQQSGGEQVPGRPPPRCISSERFCVSRHSASPTLWGPRGVLVLLAFTPAGALRHLHRPHPLRQPPYGAPGGERRPVPARRLSSVSLA